MNPEVQPEVNPEVQPEVDLYQILISHWKSKGRHRNVTFL